LLREFGKKSSVQVAYITPVGGPTEEQEEEEQMKERRREITRCNFAD